jgi:hypothetical protein
VTAWEEFSAPDHLILVRCRGCRKPVARYCLSADGIGEWKRDFRRGPCVCGRAPTLPEGRELDRLIAEAQAKGVNNVRAAKTVFR